MKISGMHKKNLNEDCVFAKVDAYQFAFAVLLKYPEGISVKCYNR